MHGHIEFSFRTLAENCCLQNQCRPPGSEALPRGIVQDKSNFEFESLGGNPGRKGVAAGRPAKSLLAIPVGIKQKAVVDKLVSKVRPIVARSSYRADARSSPRPALDSMLNCSP